MEIESLIPQRPPFLFIDSILKREDNKIETKYLVKGTEDFFKGHFPGNPIMPGVLLQEALFQSAAALMSVKGEGIGVITRVKNAKFKNLVRPHDQLLMEVELVSQLENAYYFKGKTKVQSKVIAVIEFTCALIKKVEKE